MGSRTMWSGWWCRLPASWEERPKIFQRPAEPWCSVPHQDALNYASLEDPQEAPAGLTPGGSEPSCRLRLTPGQIQSAVDTRTGAMPSPMPMNGFKARP